ncbi:hypothetical protein PC121_g22252 [Phytophthora cactorum]|nr:hypothetical protein PC121_g22252 [Phytophthora cactorum]
MLKYGQRYSSSHQTIVRNEDQCVDSSVDAYEHTGQDAADQQPEADLPIRETHIESVLDEAGRKTPHDSACDEGGPWPNTSASL